MFALSLTRACDLSVFARELLRLEAAGLVTQRHMEGDDVALLEQLLKRHILHTHGLHIGLLAAAPGDDLGAEGHQETYGGGAYGAGADDTHGLTPQLAAEEGAAAAALAYLLVERDAIAQQVEHHAHRQLADGRGAVACGVLHCDIVFCTIAEVDMVQSGEGHAEVAQLAALRQHRGGQLDVADDGDVGLAHALNERRLVLLAVHIIGEGMPHGGIMLLELLEAGLGDAQGFYTDDIHIDDE